MSVNAKLEDFYEFLRKRAGVLDLTCPISSDKCSKQLMLPVQQSQQSYKRLDKQQKSFVAASREDKDTSQLQCLLCGGDEEDESLRPGKLLAQQEISRSPLPT
ncbi:hypothetical protein ACJJTC_003034 [Scirpophaga incertulas]